jgi:lactate dehydrogenase-like 2-hydroxyacid dehydrogenase
MIDKEQFVMMKKTAVLVNTARGALINEAALVEALVEKRMAALVLMYLQVNQ